MKIMHITKKYPPCVGGDAVVVKNLQRMQRLAGHKVVIVTSNCAGVGGEGIYTFGVRDTPAGLDAITPKRLLSLLALGVRMFGIISKERPNVIHTHSVDMAFFASFAARWFGIPMVHTFHIVTFYDRTQSALRRKTELWLAKKAGLSLATAPNPHDVQQLHAGGLTQTVLMPNGVDIAFWGAADRHPSTGPFTFVTVGRLEKQKGYTYLVKAAARLAKTAPAAFKVIIIGDGSQQATLRALIKRLNVTHVVELVGTQTPEAVRAIFTQAHAAVFPSLYETTPLTLLEAWAASLPVIATPVGILRDTPSNFNAAYIVPVKNASKLARAMGAYITDTSLRNAAMRQGRAEVAKYTWPAIARSAESLYVNAT